MISNTIIEKGVQCIKSEESSQELYCNTISELEELDKKLNLSIDFKKKMVNIKIIFN